MKASEFKIKLEEIIENFGDAEIIVVKDFDTSYEVLGVCNMHDVDISGRNPTRYIVIDAKFKNREQGK